MWALAFVGMFVILGLTAAFIVYLVEKGHTVRDADHEQTVRLGMENAWQLEQRKLDVRSELIAKAKELSELTKSNGEASLSEVTYTQGQRGR